ncbi:hypothetical protein HMPREF1581_00307 [Gardnerella vaginalis JCP8108]|uniref:Uncharacterized protein n=1 Tax=Gardnerella vaginalis JCP8108 TaxID=1261066 RepID=S4GIW6_GARVA|nr:hypothetical protein HMPREF1581_00307 [Gardnerella vaginalis JCP8108]
MSANKNHIPPAATPIIAIFFSASYGCRICALVNIIAIIIIIIIII